MVRLLLKRGAHPEREYRGPARLDNAVAHRIASSLSRACYRAMVQTRIRAVPTRR
jgi:hypothetical protein